MVLLPSVEEVEDFGEQHGYPIIIKASLGGGGRGMRIVRKIEEVEEAYDRAKSEAKAAFGNDEVYVEKFIKNQNILKYRFLVILMEILFIFMKEIVQIQRRHQKVVEIAPSVSLSVELRISICEAAVKLMKNVDYLNAGTVEFLVSG